LTVMMRQWWKERLVSLLLLGLLSVGLSGSAKWIMLLMMKQNDRRW
jgi:hypothetical protein